MERSVATIQARMGSSRLPGKVLLDLGGRPVIEWVVRAARAIVGVDEVVVATSDSILDEEIVAWCGRNDTRCIKGDEHDVLGRYGVAAKETRAEIVLRITADCPLLDPAICGEVLALSKRTNADLATNADPPTWPEGLSCEVVKAEALGRAVREAVRPSEREHVLPFISHRRNQFKVRSLLCPLPGLQVERWTLDTGPDYEFLGEVVERISVDRPPSYLQVLSVLDREPNLRRINQGVQRNVGAAVSREREANNLAPAVFPISEALSVSLIGRTFAGAGSAAREAASGLFLTHGRRAHVWDVDGNRYVDFWCGSPPMLMGHAHPEVEAACRDAASNGDNPAFAAVIGERVAKRISVSTGCDAVVFFSSAEAAIHTLIASITDGSITFIDGDLERPRWTGAGSDAVGAVIVTLSGKQAEDRAAVQRAVEIATDTNTVLIANISATFLCVPDDGLFGEARERIDVLVAGGPLGNGRNVAFAAGRGKHIPRSVPRHLQPSATAFAAAEVVLATLETGDASSKLWATAADAVEILNKVAKSCEARVRFLQSGGNVERIAADPAADDALVSDEVLDQELRRYGLMVNGLHRFSLAHDSFDLRHAAVAYERAFRSLGSASP